jgi:hypothetical protein
MFINLWFIGFDPRGEKGVESIVWSFYLTCTRIFILFYFFVMLNGGLPATAASSQAVGGPGSGSRDILGVWCWRWHWLVCLLLVCGVDYSGRLGLSQQYIFSFFSRKEILELGRTNFCGQLSVI